MRAVSRVFPAVFVGSLALILLAGCSPTGPRPATGGTPVIPPSQVFDIPRLADITIDGSADDWGTSGLQIPVLIPAEGRLRDPNSYDVQLRLAWTDAGLLVLATIRDDVWHEHASIDSLWSRDSLEIFLADRLNSPDIGQWIVAPGMAAEFSAPRLHFNDTRATPALKAATTQPAVGRKAILNGCVVEMQIPWAAVGIKPATGKEVACQFFSTDHDRIGRPQTFVWYPVHKNPQGDGRLMNRLRLMANSASPPARLAAAAHFDEDRGQMIVSVTGRDVAGHTVELVADGQVLARTAWDQHVGLSSQELSVPLPPPGTEYGPVEVQIDGKALTHVALPSASKARAERILFHPVRAYPSSTFTGTLLPDVDFHNPLVAEQYLGRYWKSVTYYDADYNIVRTAGRPGRYGAVLNITTANGQTLRRFVTLYRSAEDVQWWQTDVRSQVALPASAGVDPAEQAACQEELCDFFKWRAIEHLDDDASAAIMLAGLCSGASTRPAADSAMRDAPAFYSNGLQQDRRWWLGLKRKLYGWDKQFARPVALPLPATRPAPVVREGTLAEAGMTPAGVTKIDELCKTWAADSDQAFNVCIVRHGVIALHKAYGQRDGRDLTVNDTSRMASISKFICGVSALQMLDQGQLRLTDPVGMYLPPLKAREAQMNRPLTLRHLFTHTNGFVGWHWGDESSDMEERVAGYLPYMQVGEAYNYNGSGLAMAGKVMEAVSGQTLPDYYQSHLFAPLGCTKIELGDGSHGARSTPLDMARIGQLVLNRGSYGDRQFFRPERLDDLLPAPLGDLCPSRASLRYGLGCVDYPKEPLGPHTYGHGAASSATLRISFDNDLVVVMCRNSAGRNFEKYHPQFLKAIADAVADTVAKE